MSTLIKSTTRVGRPGLPGLPGRRSWGLAVPLLVAGALAAGCGSASSSAPAAGGTGAGGTVSSGTASGGTASGGTASSGTASSGNTAGGTAASGAPTSGAVHGSAPATPVVPTVSGGPVAAGGVNCVGWPSGTGSVSLPTSFVPVSVERCVNGVTAVPGKGLWTTATLQRATSDLSGLVNALREPSATRKPGTICPALAVIPPQVVLINAAGEKLIPRIPVGGCGLPAAQVLSALDSLHWQQVSVRLIAQLSRGTSPKAPSGSGPAPNSTPTSSGGQVHPG
jgi:hypothetical protein